MNTSMDGWTYRWMDRQTDKHSPIDRQANLLFRIDPLLCRWQKKLKKCQLASRRCKQRHCVCFLYLMKLNEHLNFSWVSLVIFYLHLIVKWCRWKLPKWKQNDGSPRALRFQIKERCGTGGRAGSTQYAQCGWVWLMLVHTSCSTCWISNPIGRI